METVENKPKIDPNVDVMSVPKRPFKQKLGDLGRKIKGVDLKNQIVMHPFPAVGIAAAAGAIIGFARPMPRRGPITGALMTLFGAIGYRLVREAVMLQLSSYTKEWLRNSKVAAGTNPERRPDQGHL